MEPKAHPTMFRGNPPAFVLGLLVPVVGWLALLGWWISCRATTLELGPEGIVYSQGILTRQQVRVRPRNIRSVEVRQNLWQRIFRAGDLAIWTAGDRPEILAQGLAAPHEVARRIEALRD